MKINLKTPISYYGGKQKLCCRILELIPQHTLYCEAFTGGGAVFFGKQPSGVEVLNDTNREMMNFYQVSQNQFAALDKKIKSTLHSRDQHRNASIIYNFPSLFSSVDRAWAVWTLSTQSFASMIDGSWGYDKKTATTSRKISSKRRGFVRAFAERLENVQMECSDALYVIESRDTPESFFYCDPPYFNSDCGHYDGYSEQDFTSLLELLSRIRGKFLLSSYPSPVLKEFTKTFGWHHIAIDQTVSVNARSGYHSRKVETLTANYPI